jgi:hypothetical protein
MSATKLDARAREIVWETATVENGTLTVELSGGTPRGWRGHFDGVLRLLEAGGGRWGGVSLSRNVIRVTAVSEGAEADLRHFLESAVLQTNADLGLVADPARDRDDDKRGAPDRAMAATFRSFADPRR